MSVCDDPVPNIVCTTVVARLTGRSDDIIATSTLHVPAYSYLLLSAFRDLVLSNFMILQGGIGGTPDLSFIKHKKQPHNDFPICMLLHYSTLMSYKSKKGPPP